MVVSFYLNGFDVLDNFSSHAIQIGDKVYPTLEHAYQSVKCLNEEGHEAIRSATSPVKAKHLANVVYKDYKDPEWDTKKVQIMVTLMRLKALQHEDVYDALKRSGNQQIMEASPVDSYWGIGPDGDGKNMVGECWMTVRKELFS